MFFILARTKIEQMPLFAPPNPSMRDNCSDTRVRWPGRGAKDTEFLCLPVTYGVWSVYLAKRYIVLLRFEHQNRKKIAVIAPFLAQRPAGRPDQRDESREVELTRIFCMDGFTLGKRYGRATN